MADAIVEIDLRRSQTPDTSAVDDVSRTVRAAFLHRPAPPLGGLARPQLITVLDDGITLPATLVCAPAGFGKSALVSQWCENTDVPSAWLSLGPAIDHPRWFLMHLIAAVRQVFPDALDVTSKMASAELMPPDEAMIAELSNELDELDEPIVIVLDDYHRIDDPRVQNFVADLLRHPPLAVHLVIVSREEPSLPIGTLRARGRLKELRAADLAFSADELSRFMKQELHRPLTPQQLDLLHASTEGWPAGARLAVEALRVSGNDVVVGAGFLDQAAQEYLIADLVDHAPPEVRRHLHVASHFDRFSAAICDAAASYRPTIRTEPTTTGAEFIDWLRQHNLFVVQLDATGDWYRFHHLFARLLANWRASNADGELSEKTIRLAAVAVFCEHGMLEDAIDQLHLVGADDEIAVLAAAHGQQLIEEERWVELERLVSRIPSDVVTNDPDLLLLRAWLLGEAQSRHREMSESLDRAESLLDRRDSEQRPTDRWLRGQIAELRGAYVKFINSDFEGGIADAESANTLLADRPGRHLTFSLVLGVVALASAGRSEEAHRLADSVVGDPRFADAPFDPMSWSRPFLGWLEGDLDSEERYAAQLLRIGERFNLKSTVAGAHYFLGTCAYERNRLVDAERHLSIVFDHRYVTEVIYPVHAGIALAFTELAQGRPDDAEATARSVVQFALDTGSDFLRPVADAFIAEWDLRRGRTGSGLRWARSLVSPAPRYRYMWFDPGAAHIEVLLASEPDAVRGRELLDRTLEFAQRRHYRPLTIRLLGVHALDLATRGNEPAALHALETAVRLAHNGGIIRQLADLGPRLTPLLHRLDITGDLLTHVGAVITATEAPEQQVQPPDTTPFGELALTAREADVLRLLAARYSNKEIAKELIIAPATVKKHTVTLYDKLNVHGRREAVAKAHALGYIKP